MPLETHIEHKHVTIISSMIEIVTTLALGLRPSQGLVKVQAKSEVQELHFMLPGVWESVRE
jgi:hypothetical protein